jgi:glutamyl-tRNA synthetase
LAANFAECKLLGTNADESVQVQLWLSHASNLPNFTDFRVSKEFFASLNAHLLFRTFVVGYGISLADMMLFVSLRDSPIWGRFLKEKKEQEFGVDLSRWYRHLESLEIFKSAALDQQQAYYRMKEKKKDQGLFDIGLDDSWKGRVVTRFPPEPSGYLHIGHVKAVLLNNHFAKTFQGKLIVRFDDTNPAKEKEEYENAIIQDLELLNVKGDFVSHTSDYFDKIYEFALKMIQDGNAYCDDTLQEAMREERLNCTESMRRNASVEENLRYFEEMRLATEVGQQFCLRAKIDMKSQNGTMRDPVIFRCNLLPHHITGTKYRMYPTYDFACPIVDSIEGVTHALRTNEYHDRNAQYYWFIEKLGLRRPAIWDYGRLNFVYTLLSKRKLNWLVNNNRVRGWDDPRFPTIRGILRRGLTVQALQEYILMQGASQSTLNLEWDKLWSLNKRIIDPTAPRYTVLDSKDL